MGKKRRKKRPAISIKIDGKERPFSEEIGISDWQAVKEEAAAAAEDVIEPDEFEWVLPEVDRQEVPEFQKVNYTPTKGRKQFGRKLRGNYSPGISALIISIALAVVVGLAFGIPMLKIVKTDDAIHATGSEGAVGGSEEGVKEDIGSVTVHKAELPAMSAAVIQAGVFSTKESADAMISELSAQGLATSLIVMDDLHYLFIGVSDNLDEAKVWESELKAAGVDVWAKELSIGAKELEFGSEAEATQLVSAAKLFNLLASEATGGVLTGKLNETIVEDIKKGLAASEEISQSNEAGKGLYTSLVSAYQGLVSFQESGDKAQLVKAQQALLNYLNIFQGAIT